MRPILLLAGLLSLAVLCCAQTYNCKPTACFDCPSNSNCQESASMSCAGFNQPNPQCQAGPCRCVEFTLLLLQTQQTSPGVYTTNVEVNVTNYCSEPLIYAAFGTVGTSAGQFQWITQSSFTAQAYVSPPSLALTYTVNTQNLGSVMGNSVVFTPSSNQNFVYGKFDVLQFQIKGYQPGVTTFNLQAHLGAMWDTYTAVDWSSCACDNCDAGVQKRVIFPCTLPYPLNPYNKTYPATGSAFNENECLGSFAIVGSELRMWYTDEHPMTLGVRQITVTDSSGRTGSPVNYPLASLSSNPMCIYGTPSNPIQIGQTASTGDYAATDSNNSPCPTAGGVCSRPIYPALFITDVTFDQFSTAGDWQYGGTPVVPMKICGNWKGCSRAYNKQQGTVTITVDSDSGINPNYLNFGPGDPPITWSVPVNTYQTEVAWNIDQLGLLPGHSYRFQFMVHDGDQYHPATGLSGGDVGEACIFATGACAAGWQAPACDTCDTSVQQYGYKWWCTPSGDPNNPYILQKVFLVYSCSNVDVCGFQPSLNHLDTQGYIVGCDCVRKTYPCPNACSGNGLCNPQNGTCECNPYWSGAACNISTACKPAGTACANQTGIKDPTCSQFQCDGLNCQKTPTSINNGQNCTTQKITTPDCQVAACSNGACVLTNVNVGKPCGAPTGNPCQVRVCQSDGSCQLNNLGNGQQNGCNKVYSACLQQTCQTGSCVNVSINDGGNCNASDTSSGCRYWACKNGACTPFSTGNTDCSQGGVCANRKKCDTTPPYNCIPYPVTCPNYTNGACVSTGGFCNTTTGSCQYATACCGNGVVEGAEQCDTGGVQTTPCCNATTCRFINQVSCDDNNVCSIGDACTGGVCLPTGYTQGANCSGHSGAPVSQCQLEVCSAASNSTCIVTNDPNGTGCTLPGNTTCLAPQCDGNGGCQLVNVNNGKSCNDVPHDPVCQLATCVSGMCNVTNVPDYTVSCTINGIPDTECSKALCVGGTCQEIVGRFDGTNCSNTAVNDNCHYGQCKAGSCNVYTLPGNCSLPPCYNQGTYCSGNGVCNGTDCVCLPGYAGASCNIVVKVNPHCFDYSGSCGDCLNTTNKGNLSASDIAAGGCVWCLDTASCATNASCVNSIRQCPTHNDTYIPPPCPDNCFNQSKHGFCGNNGSCVCIHGWKGINCATKGLSTAAKAAIGVGAAVGIALACAAAIVLIALAARQGYNWAVMKEAAGAASTANPLYQPTTTEHVNPLNEGL